MIEIGRQYRTRDGREVRIYAVDGGEDGPVHGAIQARFGWRITEWHSDGRYLRSSEAARDLIEVKPKTTRTYWLCHTGNATDCNLYGWTEKAEAEKWARQVNRTVSITGPHTVEFCEGDGL